MLRDDPFDVLGVPAEADEETIRLAYRRLVRQAHPDALHGDLQRFVAIREAYELLMDPQRRMALRDAARLSPRRRAQRRPPSATRPDASADATRPDPSTDAAADALTLSLEADLARRGGALTVTLTRSGVQVRAQVVLPAGVTHGQLLAAPVTVDGQPTTTRLVRVLLVTLRS